MNTEKKVVEKVTVISRLHLYGMGASLELRRGIVPGEAHMWYAIFHGEEVVAEFTETNDYRAELQALVIIRDAYLILNNDKL